ncbi:hypothetical protein BJ508DRAFT_169156 [Ascobolus immersus RN42]|uniref:Uncharacterized protein n=1 Tax=Ascobolus immersus RN42 TaxID=1160509 RepID=A0A3N4HYG1_ASCIM|nr:hypothetical protein BJ508DRAFT_169156 [Ascobolus immersus RN42]
MSTEDPEPLSLANRRLTLRRSRLRSQNLYRPPPPPRIQRSLTTPEPSIERNEYLPSSDEDQPFPLSPPRNPKRPHAASLFRSETYLTDLYDKRESDSDKSDDTNLAVDVPLFDTSNSLSPLGRPWSRKRQSSSGFSTTSTLFTDSPVDGYDSLKSPRTPPPRSKRTASLSGTSTLDQTKYIEHLERQTSELMAELHNYTSPTSTSSHMSRFRRLEADNTSLKQELQQWEERFAERLKEEMAGKVASEKTLQAKIRRLEEQVNELEELNRDAGTELMNARRRIAELKGVEVENRGLVLKVQALSEMLAEKEEEETSPRLPRTPSQRSRSSLSALNTPSALYPPSVGQSQRPSRAPSLTHSRTRSIDQYADQSFFSPRRATAASVVSGQSETPSRARSYSTLTSEDEFGVGRSGATIRARRMRRFSPGSGPKPLILPSREGSTAGSTVGMPVYLSNDLPIAELEWHTHTSQASQTSQAPSVRSRPVSIASPLREKRDSLFAELARAENEALESQPAYSPRPSRAVSSASLHSLASNLSRSSLASNRSTASMHSLSKVLASPAIIGTLLSLGTNTIWGAAKTRAVELIKRVLGNTEINAHRRRVRARRVLRAASISSSSSTSTTEESDFNSPKAPEKGTRNRGIGLMEALSRDPIVRQNFHFRSFNGLKGATPANTPLSRSPAGSTAAPPGPLGEAVEFRRTPIVRTKRRRLETPTLITTSPTPPREFLGRVQARRGVLRDNEPWLLWLRFLVALVIALGMAVREGPGSVLGGISEEEEVEGFGEDDVVVGEEAGMGLRKSFVNLQGLGAGKGEREKDGKKEIEEGQLGDMKEGERELRGGLEDGGCEVFGGLHEGWGVHLGWCFLRVGVYGPETGVSFLLSCF